MTQAGAAVAKKHTSSKKANPKAQERARLEIWQARPGRDRPTDERRRKSDFRLIDGEDAGVTVAIDETPTTLDKLRASGVISKDQAQAGLDFAALMLRTRLVSQGRSCLDFSPVGHEPEFASEQEERDETDRRELYLACGVFTWRELRWVCCEDMPPRDTQRLRDGLDVCAKFFS